ncbi:MULTISPECIES: LuxR C-terminal-related transcriptional regulator [unclassified Sporosarcina]|uniref:helix-turn-helix domain-containing protein n=1 Tax=unclassified Sporosarcina TaxID=2647733 RepID=UPI000C171521|nr:MULTISPECIES: LuxR C-terminal-related transcriptional regulator [unclassified Sporosarcina]PIC98588.1 hypothetical protein CSV68_12375 [Sporosarcina sp. P29]PID06015.1 hypothetical protein CSV66_07365 [Sporosarcina sp. P30]PID09209.1 hypothetical protein CSV65_07365 [Sporosarcina sp. P31]PID12507.1 hypothetical protein CSV64_06835 [Sporosarcina sp. P32b]
MNLAKKDYQSIINIINQTHYDSNVIQSSLSKSFALHHSLLWHADTKGNMHNLKFYNFDEQMMLDYTEVHYTNDVMHPQKHLSKLADTQETVYRIKEVTTPGELDKSLYNQFFESHQIIDQMVMYFATSTTIYGGIGFVRFKGDKPFTRRDKAILQTLSVHLQHVVKNTLNTRKAETKNTMIDTVATHQANLSNRELEVFELVTKGYSNQEIANQLWITINTVKKHLRNMYEKYEVNSRTSLIYKLEGLSNT